MNNYVEVLESYVIDLGDHCDEATEGFCTDDKNTTLKTESKSIFWDSIQYKKFSQTIIAKTWAENYLKNWEKTYALFVKNGVRDVSKFVDEFKKAQVYAKQYNDEYNQAVENNNIEKCRELRQGMINIFKELRASNRSFNNGISPYSGEMIDMPEDLKNKLKPLLTAFQDIYREMTITVAQTYVDEVESKSTIKKIFKKPREKWNRRHELYVELYRYCVDFHKTLDSVNP